MTDRERLRVSFGSPRVDGPTWARLLAAADLALPADTGAQVHVFGIPGPLTVRGAALVVPALRAAAVEAAPVGGGVWVTSAASADPAADRPGVLYVDALPAPWLTGAEGVEVYRWCGAESVRTQAPSGRFEVGSVRADDPVPAEIATDGSTPGTHCDVTGETTARWRPEWRASQGVTRVFHVEQLHGGG